MDILVVQHGLVKLFSDEAEFARFVMTLTLNTAYSVESDFRARAISRNVVDFPAPATSSAGPAASSERVDAGRARVRVRRYMSNVLFGVELTAQIVSRLVRLPKLQCVAAHSILRMPRDLPTPACELVHQRTLRVATTWDELSIMHVYCCRRGGRGAP